MNDLRSSEQTISNGGTGYRFNAEGNQISYRCDVRRVTTINYDRKVIRAADLLDSRIQADFRQITAVLESDRGIYAKNHIPEDYFYPEAVAMFQYYIRNGQADSMKEALREYDQYLHRCRLEYQATRAASASERSASAAERTAAAAERSADASERTAANSAAAANSARAIEQYSASTNFWTIYSALR